MIATATTNKDFSVIAGSTQMTAGTYKRNVMTSYKTADTSYTFASGTTTNLQMDAFTTNADPSKLNFGSNSIIVGEGITHCLISGNLEIDPGTAALYQFHIRHYDRTGVLKDSYTHARQVPTGQQGYNAAPRLVEVQAGDYFMMALYSGVAITLTIRGRLRNCLTVEAVEDINTIVISNNTIMNRLQKLEREMNDSGWLVPTLSSSWVNYGSNYSIARYRKKDGVVYLEGMLNSGTYANNSGTTPIFTLPVGMRPSKRLLHSVKTSSATIPGRVDIFENGVVQAVEGSGWLSLDGIVFIPDDI